MEKDKPQFPELEITIRAGSYDDIYGLLPAITSNILLNQGKTLGSSAGDTYNFCWRFTNEHDRRDDKWDTSNTTKC